MDITADRKRDWSEHVARAENAQRQGKYEFAEAIWLIALEEAEDFGAGDRRLAYTLEKLSECMWYQHRLDEAGSYAMRSLTVYERVLGPEDKDVGSIAGNLAMIYHLQGKHKEAEETYKKALKIKTAVLGSKHPDVQKLLGSFADLLQSLGRQEEANQLRISARMVTKKQWSKTGGYKALDSTETRKDLDQPTTPVPPVIDDEATHKTWDEYKREAEKALKAGDYLEAERLWIYSLPTARGEDKNNPNYCYALESIGEISIRLEKYRDAERCFINSYDIKQKVLGREHNAVARSASGLAKLYYTMCDYSKSEKFAKQAVEVYEKTGGESKELACALHNLATLYHVQRSYQEAESYYQRALKLKQKLFGQ
ncbi:MAG: tetratricopeptide repeat protein, partial [Cyanobacteria bacterium]|nr:tetratricopeptide repeat protein [Cyanobacteriota bacterium]